VDRGDIAERRRLRRKLSFWRFAAFLVAALAVFAYGYFTERSDARLAPHVARVEVSGVVNDDEDLIGRLDLVAESDAARALILTINSPGGTTFGGEQTYKAVRRVAAVKPVVAEIRTLGASAAYMVAAAGDHIVAQETSIVGSIGVIFQYPEVSGLLDKLGVEVGEIKSAPLKAEPSPFHPASDAAKAMIRSVILDTYDWFVDLVAERRDMSRDEALVLSDGSVFTGRQALANGLIDEIGGDAEARAWLASKGVDAELPIIEWKRKDDDGFFFARAAARTVANWAGETTPLGVLLAQLGDRQLFLDGLVSVWQFGLEPSNGE
jgi:protease-4